MRTMLRALGLFVALAVCGCGSTVEEGSVPFKQTDTKQFEDMKNQMIGSMKSKSYTKNQPATPGTGSAAPAEKPK